MIENTKNGNKFEFSIFNLNFSVNVAIGEYSMELITP